MSHTYRHSGDDEDFPQKFDKRRRRRGGDDEDVRALEEAMAWSRGHPLSREELGGFGREKRGADRGLTVRPWVSAKEMKVNGKKRIVPVFGVRGTF